MSEAGGRIRPVSPARRAGCDFLYAGMRVPLASIQKVMHLEGLPEARRQTRPRPSWCALFTKAYGRVVAARPDLRQAFLSFPRERVHWQETTTADIVVELRWDDETVVVPVPLKRPDACSLADIDFRIADCVAHPAERLGRFRRALRIARLPRFVRRWVWWYLLNASASSRCYYFGTFGVTSVGNWGVDSLRPVAPWTTLLHYGAIDADGRVAMRLTYDHRVLDGSGPSTALVELERILKTEIRAELDALRAPGTALAQAG